MSDEKYGELSAEYYQLTKPPGTHYLDYPYYKKKLRGVSGPILEVGAGTGRLLLPLQKAGFKIEALEPSAPMRAWLEKNLKQQKQTCKIHNAPIEEFSHPNSYAAVILALGSFQLLKTPALARKALKNIYESLQHGGRFFVDLDILQPDLPMAHRWVSGGEIPAGANTSIAISGKRHWDMSEQLEHVHLRYEKLVGGQIESTEIQDFTLRGYERTEFETLLRDAGFGSIECWVDYSDAAGKHIAKSALTLSFVAVKS